MFGLGWYFVFVVFVLGLLVGLFFGLVLFVFCFIVCGGFFLFFILLASNALKVVIPL